MKFLSIDRLKEIIAVHWGVPLHRNTYLYTVNLLVTFISGALFWTIASHLFSPAQIGIASAFLAPTTFMATLLVLGSHHGILRFVNEIERDPDLLYSVIWFTLAVSVVGSLLGAFLCFRSGFISPVYKNITFSLILYLITIVGSALWGICEAAFVSLRASLQLMVRNIGFGILRLVLLWPFAHYGELGLLIAFTGGIGLASLLSLDLVRRNLGSSYIQLFKFRHPLLGKVVAFSLPNHLANVIAGIPTMVLPIIVFRNLGAEANGYFSIAWTIAMVVRTVLTASSATILAEGSRDPRFIHENRNRLIAFLFCVTGVSILPIIIIPGPIMLLFGTGYAAANRIALPLLAISVLPTVLPTIYIASERIKLRVRSILFYAVANAVLGVCLPWLGAHYGYLAFVIGYLTAQCIISLATIPFILHS